MKRLKKRNLKMKYKVRKIMKKKKRKSHNKKKVKNLKKI